MVCALCALLSFPAAAQVPSYVPTDGLVGWWPFNGNANDESGNGNDGTVDGATLTEDRFGNVDKAYGFDGYNDEIRIQHQTILNLEGDFSITGWYKTSEFPATNNSHTIIAKRDDNLNCCSPQVPYDLQVNYIQNSTDYRKPLLAFANGNYHFCQSDSLLALDEWTNISLTYSLDTCRIYVNGMMTHSALFPSNFRGANSSDLLIGSINRAYGDEYMNGQLDDIAIYNRALTEQEIQNLYTGTTPPPCTALPSNLQQGLVGYWPFCGNANDESGNGNDGTVNGATLTEDRFGNANAAYSFDGINNNISVPRNYQPTFSVSVWFNPSNSPQYNPLVDAFDAQWEIQLKNESPDFVSFIDANNYQEFISTQTTTTNNWYHLVCTYYSDSIAIYLDGILTDQFIANSLPVSDGNYYFGASLTGSDQFFNGNLDDIGIWNRALTAEEVQELYTLDACTFTVYDTTYVTVYDTLTTYETVYDTLYTYETIYDTVTTYVTVTDTLLIDITFTGIEGQPSWLNTVTVFPNPASDHITIDYGNFALMAGYNTIITDAAGASVYSSAVNSQQVEIDINAWGATGVYYMSVYDASGELVAVRHIVLE